MYPVFFIDLTYTLIKKALVDQVAISYKKRLIQFGIFTLLGILFLNNALILFGLSLYNYLLSLPLNAISSAIVIGVIFLLIGILCMVIASRIGSNKKHIQDSSIVKDTVNSFLSGFKEG